MATFDTPSTAPARRARRGPLTRLLEVRGVIGGHAVPYADVRLRAADGVALSAMYLPGPAVAAPAVVIAHGFAASAGKPAYARLADRLSTVAHVLALDLRGHGRSAGYSTLGDREALDVAAAVTWLRRFGHPWVAAIGVSMGGTAVLHACWLAADGDTATNPDAAVLISAPAWFRDEPDSAAMRRLKSAWETPWKRHGIRIALKVSLVAPAAWSPPPHPAEMAERVRVPMLVVHGTDDAYFPMSDAETLTARAGRAATLWREPVGFGHAEDGLTPAFADDLGRAIVRAHADGAFPTGRQATG